MASCLTDLSKNVSTKVRVINSFKTDVGIQQDEVLRGTELIDSKNIDVILSLESLSENNKPTRRIQLHKYSKKGDNSDHDSRHNFKNSQKLSDLTYIIKYL